VDPDEGQVTKGPALMSASAKSDWSQSDTDISNRRMSVVYFAVLASIISTIIYFNLIKHLVWFG
jgi:hypothetical protein